MFIQTAPEHMRKAQLMTMVSGQFLVQGAEKALQKPTQVLCGFPG